MSDEKMLDWVEFVTDKFAKNHEPWTYSRETTGLKHIRYESDYTGYNHWTKRLGRFFNWITVRYWKPKHIWKDLESGKSFWRKLTEWPASIASWFRVALQKDSNLPDGLVNGSIVTHWEEDGEYITMFCPYVGREVLKFLRSDPDNPHAKEILRAMRETAQVSWPKNEEANV